MNRILYLLLLLGFFSCTDSNEKSIIYPSENSEERIIWERNRLIDPITGEVPSNIRKKEMIFYTFSY